MKKKDKTGKIDSTTKEVKISNQDIIKIAYAVKDLLTPLWGAKLTFDRAYYYHSCFYKVQEFLEKLDPEYLEAYEEVVAFYRDGRVRYKDMETLNYIRGNRIWFG